MASLYRSASCALRVCCCLLVLSLGAITHAFAAPSVSVTMTSSPQFVLDSNNPCISGPRATYVSYRITNTSGSALTDLRATISGFSGGISLGSGQPSQQYIGTLAAGASKTVFWFVTFPCTFGNAVTLSASVSDLTPGATVGSGTVTTSSMISAQAGGVLDAAQLGAGAVLGQELYSDVDFVFGGASAGDYYNLQPAGNASFNAGCFQLVRSQITASVVTAIPASPASDDKLYFTAAVSQSGTNRTLTVRYWFRYRCINTASTMQPYSAVLNATQLKYSSNFETFVGPTLPAATEPFTLTKSVDQAARFTGGTVNYTITISNPSSFPMTLDSIVDVLPSGMTFSALHASSGITAANSASIPSAGASGTLVFRSSASSRYPINPGGTLTLIYSASVSSTVAAYVNTVNPYVANASIGSASATVSVVNAPNITATHSLDPSPGVYAGGELTVTLHFANEGAAPASNVAITDSVPSGLDFKLNSATHVLPGGLDAAVTYSSDGGSTWTYAPVSGGCGAPAGYDGCVQRLRWVLDGRLPAGMAPSDARVAFIARVR